MHHFRMSVAVVGMVALFATATQAQPVPVSPVDAVILTQDNWDAFAPAGKEVDAIYGDILLRNGEITAVIAAPTATRHANMTVRDVGGCPIDLTRTDHPSDQLSCYYPGQRRFPYRSWKVLDATMTPLAVEGLSHQGPAATLIVAAEAADGQPAVETTYSLTATQPWLEIATRFSNPHASAITVPLIDDVRIDGSNEDMQKSPDGLHDLFTVVDNFWQQAYGCVAVAADRRIQSTNERASILKFVDAGGQETITLQPGESFTLTRRVLPGRNLFDVRARLGMPTDGKLTPVAMRFFDELRWPIPQARFEVFDSGGQSLGAAIADENGDLELVLPAGSYTTTVTTLGAAIQENQPLVVKDFGGHSETRVIPGYRPGSVVAKIADERGQLIPCKVEFGAEEGTPQPNFGPMTAEFGVRNLRYAPHGEFTQPLPPGKYRVVVSRGPEYDAIFTSIEVPPGGEVPLTGTLVRSVDTTGWISSDFHSHSSPSGDNTSSQLGRVLNLVCEHIEFAPCTEHNRISSYVPHIEQLHIGPFMGTCSGMELTGSPLPLNHQNAFPLHEHRHEQDGGGPVTDGDPSTQIERLALWDNRSDKLIQQNHPDIGWLFFDKDGNGEPDEGFSRGFGYMDVIEVHPLDFVIKLEPTWDYDGKKYNHALFNWLQLLNQGQIITGVVNTDAHYNFHGSGSMRNWIASPTDDPAKVQPLDIVHASEDGRLVMSNGPFLTMTVNEAGKDELAGIGHDLAANSGKVQVHVRVQCANWLDIDRMFLLVNGRKHETHSYTREKDPEMFGDTAVKFDRTLDVALERDAHIIAVAASEKPLPMTIYGLGGIFHAAAVTNPIFIDVDGGGFLPNQDTLGSPLPVKAAN